MAQRFTYDACICGESDDTIVGTMERARQMEWAEGIGTVGVFVLVPIVWREIGFQNFLIKWRIGIAVYLLNVLLIGGVAFGRTSKGHSLRCGLRYAFLRIF